MSEFKRKSLSLGASCTYLARILHASCTYLARILHVSCTCVAPSPPTRPATQEGPPRRPGQFPAGRAGALRLSQRWTRRWASLSGAKRRQAPPGNAGRRRRRLAPPGASRPACPRTCLPAPQPALLRRARPVCPLTPPAFLPRSTHLPHPPNYPSRLAPPHANRAPAMVSPSARPPHPIGNPTHTALRTLAFGSKWTTQNRDALCKKHTLRQ